MDKYKLMKSDQELCGKESALISSSKENEEILESVGTGPKNARSEKGICTVVVPVRAMGAIPAMVALPRHATSVE